MAVTTVYVRDIANGRVHKRYKEDGVRGLFSNEFDGANSSGAYEVLTDVEMTDVSLRDLCGRCFPGAVSDPFGEPL